MISAVTQIFDTLAVARIRLGRRSWSSFHACGCIGLLTATILAMVLASKTGLSFGMIGVIFLTGTTTFLALVLLVKIATGEEQLIYYHQEISIVLATALVLKIVHRPVLAYLDITILGIGTFLAFGRIGCLMVGCCHGRFCSWGIRYRHEHAEEGFPPHLVDVRLFPIQAVESLWVLAVVIGGTTAVLQGRPPGTALALYTIGYGAARFGFEFVRGDTDRPYTWGFSQGQWLSLWLMSGVIAAELTCRMALVRWHVAVFACVVAAMPVAALHRKLDHTEKYRLLHPYHVSEIAEALRRAGPSHATKPKDVIVASTSMGVQISTAEILNGQKKIHQYSFSRRTAGITPATAAMLGELVMRLQHVTGRSELVAGEHGIFHLLVRDAEGTELAA